MKSSEKGFTLVELLIAMSLFIAVLLIATSSFELIIEKASRLTRSEESSIEGLIGLEIFRHDLMQSGFGLLFEYSGSAPQFPEAASAPASNLNTPSNQIPLPLSAANNVAAISDSGNTTVAGSDYLAIRAASVSTNANAKRWTYVQYSSSGKTAKLWPSGADNISDGTWVVLLRRTFTSSGFVNSLVQDSSAAVNTYQNYATQFTSSTPFTNAAFRPQNPDEFLYVYALGDKPPRMPFNRADYFIATGNVPSVCAENSGVLYKAVVNHTVGGGKDGALEYIPILDCVADMQVVFGWDLSADDGIIDTWSNADGTTVSGVGTIAEVQSALGSASAMRARLRLIKVYLLVQDGRIDRKYTAPSATIVVGDTSEASLTRSYTLTGNMINHRWKLKKLVVRPPNLVEGQ